MGEGESNCKRVMRDTPELVEKVARIIGAIYDGYADPIETPNNWARAETAARAAIQAMIDALPEDGK